MATMKQKQDPPFRLWLTALALALLGIALSVIVGCSPRIVEREVVRTHHDTLRVVDKQRDSIFHRDSIYLVERWMGDTLLREKTREIIRYHDRTQHDTIVKVVVKESSQKVVKEKKKPPWSSFLNSPVVWLVLLLSIAIICNKLKK